MTFNGIYTPIITPFDESGVIDYVKMKHNLEKWGKTDLDGIVVLGSNGEFVYLTEAEFPAKAPRKPSKQPKKLPPSAWTPFSFFLLTITEAP